MRWFFFFFRLPSAAAEMKYSFFIYKMRCYDQEYFVFTFSQKEKRSVRLSVLIAYRHSRKRRHMLSFHRLTSLIEVLIVT